MPRTISLRSAFVVAVWITAGIASPASAQPLAGWAGTIRCELQSQAQGYSHQETQTWTLTGAAPTMQGAITVYPATWTVTGAGWHDRSRNNFRRIAQWTVNGSPVSAPIGFTRRPVGGQFAVAKWHAQLATSGGYTGTDQNISDGVPQTPRRLVATLYEWQFPTIEAAATETQLAGSHTSEVRAFLGPLQPEDAQSIVTCTWALGRGSVPAMAPPSMAPPTPPPAFEGATSAPPPAAPPAAPAAPVVTTTSPPVTSPSTPLVPPPGGTPAITGGTIATTSTPTGTLTATPTAAPTGGGVTAATARDPANFAAKQTADGTVLLTWDAVPGAGSYLLGGPGLNAGISIRATSHTVTGIPSGAHTWTVATIYDPGGILTTGDNWSRASATVVNRSGRYRVVFAGFRVIRPTFDDRFGGNGDEVYASAAITTIDRTNDAVLQPRQVVRTAAYGDVSRGELRVRAGSFSSTGGLWSGDIVPSNPPPIPTPQLPLELWSGTLRDGVEAVVINPVLWEEDGHLAYYNDWANENLSIRKQPARVAAHAAAVKDRAVRGDVTPFWGQLINLCSSASDLIPDCSPGNDRQIGINRHTCVGDTFSSGLLSWCELTVVLTREGIEKALALPVIGGAPPGTIVIPLPEPSGVDLIKGGLDGNYEMYLRVERVP